MTFTVYSKPACPQCDQSKALIKAKGFDYTEIILDVGQPKVDGTKYITREELLAKAPGARMMPQIFKDGQHIGSLNELKASLG